MFISKGMDQPMEFSMPEYLSGQQFPSLVATRKSQRYSIDIYNGLFVSHKKEQNNAICSNVDGPRDYHIREASQTQKDKYHMISLICGIKNMTQMNLFIKQKQTHREQTCDCQRGGRGEVRMDWKFGISRQKLLCIGWINNKALLYSTGDYIQYTGSLCCTSETNIINQLYFSKK